VVSYDQVSVALFEMDNGRTNTGKLVNYSVQEFAEALKEVRVVETQVVPVHTRAQDKTHTEELTKSSANERRC